jgi:hypothetical protein
MVILEIVIIFARRTYLFIPWMVPWTTVEKDDVNNQIPPTSKTNVQLVFLMKYIDSSEELLMNTNVAVTEKMRDNVKIDLATAQALRPSSVWKSAIYFVAET